MALISAAFAGAAALFAWLTWAEARRSNELSLHARRLEVYRAVQDLRNVMQSNGISVQTPQVARFSRVLSEAKFCFKKKETSAAIRSYYKACFDLGELNRKISRTNIEVPKRAALQVSQDRALESEEELFKKAVELMENEVRLSL